MTTASIAGSSASAIGAAYQRRGPTHVNGEARSLHTGSVRTRWPSISTRVAEWPIQVTRRPLAGVVSKRLRSPATVDGGCAGAVSGLACAAPFTMALRLL